MSILKRTSKVIYDSRPISFGVLGDSGQAGLLSDTEAVATCIKSYHPEFIVHTGDVNYSGADKVFPYFLDYWSGYINQMFMTYGNHDLYYDYGLTLVNNIPRMKQLLGYSKIVNELYCYDFVKGPVHFFVLNSGLGDDVPSEASDPKMKLQEQLNEMIPKIQRSTSPWNIVVVHRPPYSNESLHNGGSVNLRLDYKGLGVQAVLSGHSHIYERFLIDGVTYIVQGLGGAGKRCEGTIVTPSKSVFCDKNGYTMCTADGKSLTFKTYDVDKVLRDTHTITK
jgi:predicted phosphodiesterase